MKFGILFLVLVPCTTPAEQSEPSEPMLASLRLNLPITSAKDLVKMGNTYVDRQEYDRALEFFNKAINVRKPELSHYGYRAKCYLKKGDPINALSDFKHVVESPKYNRFAECIFYKDDFEALGKMLFEKECYHDAVWSFSEALKMNSDQGPYLVLRGKCYLRTDNFDAAISDFSKAVGKLEEPSEVFTLLREALLRKSGKFDETTRGDPRATNSKLLEYGDNLFENYKYSEALKFYNEAITEESPASCRDRQTVCNTSTGNLDAALSGLKRAVETETRTDILEAWQFSGLGKELLKKDDRIDEALWCLSEAIKLNPESRYSYHYRSICYSKKGDSKAAVLDYRKARELEMGIIKEPGANSCIAYLPEIFLKCSVSDIDADGVKFLMNLADQLLQDNLFDDAVWCSSELIKKDPSQGSYHFLRGKCYLLMKNYDSAIFDLTEAVRLLEDPADVFLHLRKAFLLKSGKFDDTTKDDPMASNNDILEHANTLVDMKKFDVALKFYQEALTEDSPVSYYDRQAICYIRMEKLDAALSYLRNAVESGERTDVLDDTVFGDLGRMLVYRKRIDDAYWCASEAIKMAPSKWIHLETRAKCHFQMGKFDSAISDLKEAFILFDDKLEWQKKDNTAGLLRDCVMKCGRFDDDIKETLKLLLNDIHLDLLGSYLLEDGKAEEALFCFNEALKLSPDKIWLMCGQGRCYANMKQYDKAISILKEGISKIDYFYREDWYSLIDASLSVGKFDNLQKEICRLTKEHFEELAQMFLKKNEFEKGIRVCDEGIRRFPDTSRPLLFEVRGQCYEKMGNTEMAKPDLEKAEKLKDSFIRQHYSRYEQRRARRYAKSGFDSDSDSSGDFEMYHSRDSYHLLPFPKDDEN